ncbi:MAG: efflux RND transporter periplasmic adaptor subunit [Candidatus Omnitrophica bacterium]|nr:efflux RND transporter periplasmic adaptor subunit [Candidatus Omnitrophota bacterium]MCM8797896.1 efflux RND transporter periplasmic adaptor subunit [Candidatus Omnitrophota bacterium]
MGKLSPKNLRIIILILLVFSLIILAKKLAKPTASEKKKETRTEIARTLESKKKEKKKEEKAAGIPTALEQLLLGAGEAEKVPVKVYKISRIDFQDELPIVGTVKSIPEIDLKFEVNGRIVEFRFKEGERVRKGDLLARLDSKDARLELAWAEAKYNAAIAEAEAVRKRTETIEKLYEAGAIVEARVEEARAEVKAAEERIKVAKAEVESAKARLEKTNLYAPEGGIMGPREMDVGEFVTPNERIGTLFSEENTFIEVGVIEKDIGKVQIGQRAVVNVDTYPHTDFYGIIENIFPNLEARTRTLNVRIRLIERKAGLLPGMFARTRVIVYTKKNALVVPSNVLTVEGQRYFVPVVMDNRVNNKEVYLEYVTMDYAVVQRGIEEGDLVIIETPGLKKLKDGTPVEITETQEKLALGT